MKTIYYILGICLAGLLAAACGQSDALDEGAGYLKLDVEQSSYVVPTRIVAEYNPKQIAIAIVNSAGQTVKEIDDYSTLQGSSIRLNPGTYTIYASSYGFDGTESGYEIPYYTGSTRASVSTNATTTASITCTLANVKVSVEYSDDFAANFASAQTDVSATNAGVSPLSFTMGEAKKAGYFPEGGNLTAHLKVTNKGGTVHTRDDQVTDIKGRDHVIFRYRLKPSGTVDDVTVSVDGTLIIYTFNVMVPTTPTTELATTQATDIWSRFATMHGIVMSSVSPLDAANMKFAYKEKSADTWNEVSADESEADTYQALAKDLLPGTTYQYKMVYKGAEEFTGDVMEFTTDTENKIPNLNFDDWVKNGKHWYANPSMDAMFWDSGNEGANTISEINPTCPEETVVVKGKAAKLWTTVTAGQLAAGSLFTGDFGKAQVIGGVGAQLSFGRPFGERPAQMTGYYRYAPGSVDKSKLDNVPTGTRDQCSIYILLTDWDAPFAVNTANNTFVDFNADYVIAYGSLEDAGYEVSPAEAMTEYQPFSIDIKYRDLTRKPTHVLIVATSSKYGDYFTGSTSSVLYLDEFDLVYGKPAVDPDYIQ